MQKIHLTISKKAETGKPKMSDVWDDLSTTETRSWTIEEIATAVGEWGHSFCHAIFDGDIRGDHFLSSQLLVLDFDGIDKPFSPKQVIDLLQEYGLKANIIYRTFSDAISENLSNQEKLKVVRRFRVIIVLDELITDVNFYDTVLRDGVYTLFPEADHAPHKVQTWAGGKDVIYLDTEHRMSVFEFMNASHAFAARDKKSPQEVGKIYKKMLDAIPPYNIKGGDASKVASCKSIYIQPAKNEIPPPIRNFDWAAARRKCKLLDDFLGCKRKIWHHELLGLYTAMKKNTGREKEMERDREKQ